MLPLGLTRYPVIAGPTAGGKTALAVEVALRVNERAGRAATEVVSADSMLIYRGLDIGAAKPTTEERRGIPHHLIDVAEPTDRFTVHDWLTLANRTIAEIIARGSLPIVVGGTHLYIKALLEGLFEGPGEDAALRERLRALPPGELRQRLEQVDPAAAARLHPNDLRRTIRALEVFELTGKTISEHQTQWGLGTPPLRGGLPSVLIGLSWPSELLNPRISARVKKMMEDGLLEEARELWQQGRLGPQAREGLGYKQLIEHFEGRCSLEDAVEEIKIETRRFAKNQRTWLRRLRTTPGSVWIDAAATPTETWATLVLQACA
ncbi:MAG TPA: tRNA (adenosine(37)-N6)-dimethylallyltransferase MiaA [Phycisphaerales bacterium]|nr:tRNA (adenosine(37)-N6)-dimethylallyltransferase MiaA [Phycisphaerales bacterium]